MLGGYIQTTEESSFDGETHSLSLTLVRLTTTITAEEDTVCINVYLSGGQVDVSSCLD